MLHERVPQFICSVLSGLGVCVNCVLLTFVLLVRWQNNCKCSSFVCGTDRSYNYLQSTYLSGENTGENLDVFPSSVLWLKAPHIWPMDCGVNSLKNNGSHRGILTHTHTLHQLCCRVDYFSKKALHYQWLYCMKERCFCWWEILHWFTEVLRSSQTSHMYVRRRWQRVYALSASFALCYLNVCVRWLIPPICSIEPGLTFTAQAARNHFIGFLWARLCQGLTVPMLESCAKAFCEWISYY